MERTIPWFVMEPSLGFTKYTATSPCLFMTYGLAVKSMKETQKWNCRGSMELSRFWGGTVPSKPASMELSGIGRWSRENPTKV